IPSAPRSTLFPYTTLFRSVLAGSFRKIVGPIVIMAALLVLSRPAAAKFSADLQGQSNGDTNWISSNLGGWHDCDLVPLRVYLTRSEEHTSELQSRSDLVCR